MSARRRVVKRWTRAEPWALSYPARLWDSMSPSERVDAVNRQRRLLSPDTIVPVALLDNIALQEIFE